MYIAKDNGIQNVTADHLPFGHLFLMSVQNSLLVKTFVSQLSLKILICKLNSEYNTVNARLQKI